MKGWLYFLAGIGCAIGVGLYFQGPARVERAESGSAPAGITASRAPAVSEPGTCFLTVPVRVPASYGTVTLPRGTALRYLGEQDGKIVVAKMIGIATFALARKVDPFSADSQFASGIRRFGYRLDTVRAWEHPTAWQFNAGTQKVEEVRKKTEYLYYVARDLSNGDLTLSKYEGYDSPLRTIFTEFSSDVGGLHPTSLDGRESVLRLARALSYETQSDITPLRKEDFTWYHWHELEMDMEARTVLKKDFDHMLSAAEERFDDPFH
jgi:hypothetical protein